MAVLQKEAGGENPPRESWLVWLGITEISSKLWFILSLNKLYRTESRVNWLIKKKKKELIYKYVKPKY